MDHTISATRIGVMAIAGLMLSACASTPEGDTSTSPSTSTSTSAQADGRPSSRQFTPDGQLSVCPRITAANAPTIDESGAVIGYKAFVLVENKVILAVTPVNDACLTSGFGIRSHRPHKGTDVQSKPAGMVHAAAKGVIREAGYRDDYGNYVVIDHGDKVFTRYAHLANLEGGLGVGTTIPYGTPLGKMGNTASYTIPVHLHYEVLVGDYDTPKKSFGLMPVNPFDYPYVG